MSDSFSFTYGEPTLPIDSPPSAEPTKLAFFSGMHHFKTHPNIINRLYIYIIHMNSSHAHVPMNGWLNAQYPRRFAMAMIASWFITPMNTSINYNTMWCPIVS